MRGRSFKDYFGRDRKALYIVLGIVMISVLTLSVVYAALSTTLNINGQAEVSSASWDIHLDNVQLNSSSATTTAPTITNSTTATFSTALTKPGDFYEFTIDVVNDGSIDAMIDGVTKTPTLTTAQAKYLNYIVEYQNGEPINNKQLVAKNSFVRLKVKLEFRKDITVSDLPTTSETLNLSFTVNYVQSDGSGSGVTDNGVYDQYKIGTEKCFGTECFYVISSTADTVTMLAKYNLYVGGKYENYAYEDYGEEATGIQDSTMLARQSSYPFYGVTRFTSEYYWSSITSITYVYNSNSSIYTYIENYKTYLENQGVTINEARLINEEELEGLGCNTKETTCSDAPSWVYYTSYWTGVAVNYENIWVVKYNGIISNAPGISKQDWGVRPVITVSKTLF